MLKPGMKALALPNMIQTGDAVSLHDFAGKKVVLYFHSNDTTPGCTLQVSAFAVAYVGFEKLNAVSSASART